MKKLEIPVIRMFIPLLITLSCLEISAQDRIDYGDVSINGVFLGAEKQTLLKKFGQPDTILEKTDEFEGTPYREYIYSESAFFVSADRFEGFNIRDSIYRLDIIDVQTGDRTGMLKSRFPVAFENRYRDRDMTVVKIRIGEADSYILFYVANDVITAFSTWDDL